MDRIRSLAVAGPAAAAALACWAATASAIEKPFQFGFGGGATVPVGDAGDALKSGWHGTAIFRFNLPGSPIDIRGLASYRHFNLDPGTAGSDGSSKILSGLGNIAYKIPFAGPVKPYITAGIGAFNVKTSYDAAGVPDPASTTEFGIDVGAGVEFGLMGLSGFVEAKFENVYTNEGFNPAVTQDIDTQMIPVTFGVFF
jgi:opacity protein-like surface antigen